MKEYVPRGFTEFKGALKVRHPVVERAKVASLAADMKDRGWKGVPLVRVGNQLITGSHRYPAAKRVGIPVPTIPLSEVFREAGKDLKQEWNDWDESYHGKLSPNVLLDEVLTELPRGIRQKYGIQT